MKDFLFLNKKKLIFSLKIFFITFISLGLFLVLLGFITDENLKFHEIIVPFLIISIGLPILFFPLGFYVAYREFIIIDRVFRTYPFNELEKIGFNPVLLNENNKWHLTKKTKILTIDNYLIQTNVERGAPNTVRFEVNIQYQKFEKNRFKELSMFLKLNEIHFNYGNLVKIYDLKSHNLKSVNLLKLELIEFIEILKKEGLTRNNSNNYTNFTKQ